MENTPCSALTLERPSRSTPSCAKSSCSGPRRSHCQEDQFAGNDFFGSRHFGGNELAFVVALPVDLDGVNRFHGAVFISLEFLGRGEEDARIVAELGFSFFLAVILAVNLRPFGPRVCWLRAATGGLGMISN